MRASSVATIACVDGGDAKCIPSPEANECSKTSEENAVVATVVAWVCKRMGYEESVLSQRVAASWFVLFVAFPVHWITVILMIYILGHGTGWEPWFLLVIIPNSLHMLVHSPLSLRYDIKQLNLSCIEFIWGAFVHGAGYCTLVLTLVGFLSNAVNIPFNSLTWTSVGLFVLAPLLVIVDRVTNYGPTAARAGNTPISILVVSASNGVRLVDPVADFALGFQVLQQAQTGVCPWHRGDNHTQPLEGPRTDCRAHRVIAWTVMTASVLDLLIVAAYIHVLKHALKSIPDTAKQTLAEVAMLFCEASIMISVLLTSRYNLLQPSTDGGRGTGRDLQGYAVMCSISTFCCLVITTIMLIVPASFWQRLEAEGARSAVEQVLLSISIYAQAAVKVGGTQWHRMQSCRSQMRAFNSVALQSGADLALPTGSNAAMTGSTDASDGQQHGGGQHHVNVDCCAVAAAPEAGAPWHDDHGRLDPEIA